MTLGYEKARLAFEEMRKHPKRSDKIRLCDVVMELADDIKRTLKKGYSLKDVADTIREAEGIEIKEKTLKDYLYKYSRKKNGKNIKARKAAEPGGGNDWKGEGKAGVAADDAQAQAQGQAG